jgi:hypothetical protein
MLAESRMDVAGAAVLPEFGSRNGGDDAHGTERSGRRRRSGGCRIPVRRMGMDRFHAAWPWWVSNFPAGAGAPP